MMDESKYLLFTEVHDSAASVMTIYIHVTVATESTLSQLVCTRSGKHDSMFDPAI